MSTFDDLQNENIPKLKYDIKSRSLIKWDGIEEPFWAFHHFVKRQKVKRNPELNKIQKLIYFPPINKCIETIDNKLGNIHLEADAYHSKFEERWGIPLDDVVYRGR